MSESFVKVVTSPVFNNCWVACQSENKLTEPLCAVLTSVFAPLYYFRVARLTVCRHRRGQQAGGPHQCREALDSLRGGHGGEILNITL